MLCSPTLQPKTLDPSSMSPSLDLVSLPRSRAPRPLKPASRTSRGFLGPCCPWDNHRIFSTRYPLQSPFFMSIKQKKTPSIWAHGTRHFLTHHHYNRAGSSRVKFCQPSKKGPELARYGRSPFPKLGDATSNGAGAALRD